MHQFHPLVYAGQVLRRWHVELHLREGWINLCTMVSILRTGGVAHNDEGPIRVALGHVRRVAQTS